MRIPFWLTVLFMLETSNAFAGSNPTFTLPLHAKVSGPTSCTDYLPVNCLGVLPTFDIPPGSEVTIYLLVFRHCDVAGVQTAFAWDPSWVLTGSNWSCRGNQISIATPHGAGGPTDGSIVTAFDCVDGPSVAVIGYMSFHAGTSGCLSQVQSSFPLGICVVDCAQSVDLIPDSQQARLGRICVQSGGRDGCLIGPPLPQCSTPVESTTWGSIKGTYN